MESGASPAFPAAATTIFPLATALFAAMPRTSEPSDGSSDPRLIEIASTSGESTHQSIASMIPDSLPDPWALRTLPTQSPAAGATPPSLAALGPPTPSPTAIEATWVPCP